MKTPLDGLVSKFLKNKSNNVNEYENTDVDEAQDIHTSNYDVDIKDIMKESKEYDHYIIRRYVGNKVSDLGPYERLTTKNVCEALSYTHSYIKTTDGLIDKLVVLLKEGKRINIGVCGSCDSNDPFIIEALGSKNKFEKIG